MTKKLAKIISRIFEPTFEIPIILIVATSTAYLNGYRWRFLALLLFLDAILPGLYFLYLLKTKKAKDWDLSRRKDRLPLFKFATACHLAGVLVAFLINREPLAQILLAFWFLALIFTAITNYWKISLHSGVNSTLAVFAILMYGPNTRAWLLLLLPIIVSWARIAYKKHDLLQVVAGALVPMIILPLFFWAFGII
jgi:hypothetical protein